MAGEEAFWGALQDIYRQRLFKKTAWEDWQQAFEKRMNRPLEAFFNQWVYREGAPRFYLDDIKTDHSDGKWKIQGRVVQQKPYYAFPLTLLLENGHRQIFQMIDMTAGPSTPFRADSEYPPQKLILDPNVDIMRRLFDKEIPPAINSLKSSPAVLILIADNAGREFRDAADTLALSLGLKRYEFASESQLNRARLTASDLIIFGYPERKELLRRMPGKVEIHAKAFTLNGKLYDGESSVFFGVFGHPYADNRVAALFWPPASAFAETVARKITHYGKYSYVAFKGGINQDRGFWQGSELPLVYSWNPN
jgi:hypothetical protein